MNIPPGNEPSSNAQQSDMQWLDAGRGQLLQLNARLPHAILIHGDAGIGKHILAMEFVAALLCDAPLEEAHALLACGQCKNCRMFVSENHPDFHYISSEQYATSGASAHLPYTERYFEAPEKRSKRKPRKVISVDQIRLLIDDFALAQHSARRRVALIQPADRMNLNASNALLKLLEEPNPDSNLILVCDDPGRLPMTIRSRCIAQSIALPDLEQTLPWLLSQGQNEADSRQALTISGGAPLLALQYLESGQVAQFKTLMTLMASLLAEGLSPIEARESIIKLASPGTVLSWLQMVMNWLIIYSAYSDRERQLAQHAYQRELSKILKPLHEHRRPVLFQLYDDLSAMKNQDLDVINPGLLLDKWLISYSQRLRLSRGS